MGEEHLPFPSAETNTVVGMSFLVDECGGAQPFLWPGFVRLVENTTNCLGKLSLHKRFHREFPYPMPASHARRYCLAETRNDDNRHIRANAEDVLGQGGPTHKGHHLVGDHQIESPRIPAEQFKCLSAVCEGGHGITKTLQSPFGCLNLALFVVHEKNRFAAAKER